MSATCLCCSVVVLVNIFLSVSFCLRVDFRSVVCRWVETAWIQIRPNILSGLIWVQIVCKGDQQTTKVAASRQWVKYWPTSWYDSLLPQKKGALRIFWIRSFLFHYLRGKSHRDQVRNVIDPQGYSTHKDTWHVAPRSCDWNYAVSFRGWLKLLRLVES